MVGVKRLVYSFVTYENMDTGESLVYQIKT